MVHSGPPRPPRANLGQRRWKTRRKDTLRQFVHLANNCNDNRVTADNIRKTAATQGKKDVPYIAAYRDLKRNDRAAATSVAQSFRLIVPYSKQFADVNPGSTTKVVTSENGNLHENECYETRKFMNEQFSAAIPGIADETLVDMSGMPMQPSFISDQNKGIAQALDRVFPHIDANHCAQHIKMNVGRKFGKELARTYLSLGACQVLGIDCTHLQYCWQA